MVPRRSLNLCHSAAARSKIQIISRKKLVPRSKREKSGKQVANTTSPFFFFILLLFSCIRKQGFYR
jgi:hypothetical protein